MIYGKRQKVKNCCREEFDSNRDKLEMCCENDKKHVLWQYFRTCIKKAYLSL